MDKKQLRKARKKRQKQAKAKGRETKNATNAFVDFDEHKNPTEPAKTKATKTIVKRRKARVLPTALIKTLRKYKGQSYSTRIKKTRTEKGGVGNCIHFLKNTTLLSFRIQIHWKRLIGLLLSRSSR
jgi:hypothetical protein